MGSLVPFSVRKKELQIFDFPFLFSDAREVAMVLDGPIGKRMLDEAERIARAAGKDRLTLLVGSFNARAHRLYRQVGFRDWDRRPFVPFPGSDEPGEWILMIKDLA